MTDHKGYQLGSLSFSLLQIDSSQVDNLRNFLLTSTSNAQLLPNLAAQ
jgi:hypothetical protein